MRAELDALPDGVGTFTDWIDGVGEDPDADPDRGARRDRGRRAADRLRGHLAPGRRERQLPRRAWSTRPATAPSAASSHAEIPNCEGYMTPITINAPAGTVVNPVLPGRMRRARRDRLPRLRRVMGALAAARPRPRHRGRRGRADARRPRRLRRGAPALRDDRGARRQLGRAGRRATGSKASPTRSRTSATSRSS